MQIIFAGNIYDVLETKVSCGITWYKIEDEPNHYDWVHDVKIITDTVTIPKDRYKQLLQYEQEYISRQSMINSFMQNK